MIVYILALNTNLLRKNKQRIKTKKTFAINQNVYCVYSQLSIYRTVKGPTNLFETLTVRLIE